MKKALPSKRYVDTLYLLVLTAEPRGEFDQIFDFGAESGFLKSPALPEIKQERQRQDILTLVAAR